jgi:predicted protein tyrosine phosphatase
MNLLFICNQGKDRSRTAAEIYSKKYETSYAGCYSLDESLKLKEYMLKKANVLFVMEDTHINYLIENFPIYSLQKRIINIDIPNDFRYNQPELVVLLKKNINPYLKALEDLIKDF